MNLTIGKRLILWGAILLFLVCSPSLYGQNDNSAFQTLKITLNISANVNRNTFHDYWGSGEGMETLIETPFYYGRVLTGVNGSYFSNKQTDIPGFISLYIHLGWGKAVNLPSGITWLNSFHTGLFYMIFDEKETNTASRFENEFGLCLNSSLQYLFNKSLYLNLSARYLKVYTHKRIYHSYIMCGFGYYFTTPEWLRDFLR